MTRKNVECTFGMPQSQFTIIHGLARASHMHTLKHIIYACIILHNMITKNEQETYNDNFDYSYDHPDNDIPTLEVFSCTHSNLATYIQKRVYIH